MRRTLPLEHPAWVAEDRPMPWWLTLLAWVAVVASLVAIGAVVGYSVSVAGDRTTWADLERIAGELKAWHLP